MSREVLQEALELLAVATFIAPKLQAKRTEVINAGLQALERPAQQEPVAWLTEERYAEMHSSKWSPKIQQIFNKDGTLESQTIQYTPQSIPAPYPPAQRTWVGLTDSDVRKINQEVWGYVSADHARMRGYAQAIEAKLKEKNT